MTRFKDRFYSRAGTSFAIGITLVVVMLFAGRAYSAEQGGYALVDVSGVYRQMNIALMGGYFPQTTQIQGFNALAREQAQLGTLTQPQANSVSMAWDSPFRRAWSNPWSNPGFDGFSAQAPFGTAPAGLAL